MKRTNTILCNEYPKMYFEGIFNIPKNIKLVCIHQTHWINCKYANLFIKKIRKLPITHKLNI
jgi:hypothetical protein